MSKLHQAEIKQLRADARRLEVVARHLREQARSLAAEERALRAAATFFSKKSKIDPSIVITPEVLE